MSRLMPLFAGMIVPALLSPAAMADDNLVTIHNFGSAPVIEIIAMARYEMELLDGRSLEVGESASIVAPAVGVCLVNLTVVREADVLTLDDAYLCASGEFLITDTEIFWYSI